mmetsp:Transcript_6389/g.18734  ORF Transcript_6389/g.18734 Transcript_6389/m.18734 type:complete len:392 (+) Transcript_6389:2486-3661(+)
MDVQSLGGTRPISVQGIGHVGIAQVEQGACRLLLHGEGTAGGSTPLEEGEYGVEGVAGTLPIRDEGVMIVHRRGVGTLPDHGAQAEEAAEGADGIVGRAFVGEVAADGGNEVGGADGHLLLEGRAGPPVVHQDRVQIAGETAQRGGDGIGRDGLPLGAPASPAQALLVRIVQHQGGQIPPQRKVISPFLHVRVALITHPHGLLVFRPPEGQQALPFGALGAENVSAQSAVMTSHGQGEDDAVALGPRAAGAQIVGDMESLKVHRSGPCGRLGGVVVRATALIMDGVDVVPRRGHGGGRAMAGGGAGHGRGAGVMIAGRGTAVRVVTGSTAPRSIGVGAAAPAGSAVLARREAEPSGGAVTPPRDRLVLRDAGGLHPVTRSGGAAHGRDPTA